MNLTLLVIIMNVTKAMTFFWQKKAKLIMKGAKVI
jgi:hypothetical protein